MADSLLPSHWLLPETERVSALPFYCCHSCVGHLLLTATLLALLFGAMNAVAQQHLFSWDPGQPLTSDDGDDTFVHTAVNGKDDVLRLFYVPPTGEEEFQDAGVRSYLETILESSDDDDYASCAWTDSDRGTVVEVPLDTDDDEGTAESSDDDPSSDSDHEEHPVPSPDSRHNNDGHHDNAQAQSQPGSGSSGGGDSAGASSAEDYAACLESAMAARGREDPDARLHRLLLRNSEREIRLWLRANFAHDLLPSGEGDENERRAPRRRCQSSSDAGRDGCRRLAAVRRRGSWPPDMQRPPICVRVTAAEIRSSSPCFALKLTPPPPRRRPVMTATGERPSILKTPSPTPQTVTVWPTPPPRRHKAVTVAPPSPPMDTPSPDSPAFSPDVSIDVWTPPDVSFSSPDVSMEVPMSPDTSVDTFHAVPCFLLLDDPEPPVAFRKPPLPPVRPPPVSRLPPPITSAKLTTGVKGRIASARRHYFDNQQQQSKSPRDSTPKALKDRFHRFCADTQVERARLAVSVPDLADQMRRSPSPGVCIDRPPETPSPSPPSYRVQRSNERPWPAPPVAAGPFSKSLGVLETDLDADEPCTRQVTNLDAFLSRTASLMALRESRASAEDRAKSMDFLLDDDNRASALPPENALTGRVKSEHELRVERSLQNLSLPEWYKRKPKEGFLLKREPTRQDPARSASQPRWPGLGSRTPSNSSLTPGSVVIPKRISRPDWRYVSSLRSSRESLQSSTASPDSTSSSPFFSSWATCRSTRTQPYLGWRHAASVTSSAAPSPAPSTPLSGSRPVSPGRWWQPPPVDRATPLHAALYQHHHHHHEVPATNEALKNDPGNMRAMPRDRYSYIQSIYNGDTPKLSPNSNSPAKATPSRSPVSRSEDDLQDEEEEDEKSSSSVFWMESSFVGSRSTTSVVVLPDEEEESTPLRNGGDHHAPFKRGSKGNCSGDLSRSSTSERLGDSATSMEEVLDSLLAIPGSSRSSSPLLSRRTSPVPPPASPPSPVTTIHQTTVSGVERTVKFREPERDASRAVSQLPSPYEDEEEEEERRQAEQPEEEEQEERVVQIEKKKKKNRNGEQAPQETDDRTESCQNQQQQSPARMSGVRNASTIRCRRPNCKRSLPTEEARAKFRTCSNCYTYYCSRHCRKAHWERHKDQCPQTRIANLCTQILMKVREEPRSRRSLSVCARRGYLSRGRGVVKLVFLSAEDALDYLSNGRDSVKGQTFYVPRCDIMPQEMGSDVFGQVRVFCEKYNPDRKFILLVAISVMSSDGLEREVVVRGVKMRLASPLSEDEVQTLICTVTKDPPVEGDTGPGEQELRHGYEAIEAQLEERGVLLRDQYPDAYGKLLAFVERKEPFIPLNIFPMDKRTGKMFMCILLPWADEDIIKMISSKTTVVRSKRRWIL